MTYPFLSGKYKIIRQLGQGSFGKSYFAEETDANRSVVIKIFENIEIWDYLKRNEELLCSIDNPYIMQIYAVEEIEAHKCLIQEYINGITLNEYISNNDLTLAEFIKIAHGIFNAIEYLQKINLSHKDIKPSNILYDYRNQIPKLIDLDCVGLPDLSSKKYIGTIKYSSPEQIISNKPSNEADIYSFGLVLCFMILGHVPFNVDIRKTANQLETEIETALCENPELKSHIAYRIVSLVSGLLQYFPDQRLEPSNALQQIDVLQKIVKEENQENVLIHRHNIIQSNSIEFGDFTVLLEKSIAIMESLVSDDVATQKPFSNNARGARNSKHSVDNSSESINSEKGENVYREQLLREYNNILLQAKVSFGLWVCSFVIYFVILFIAITLVVKGNHAEGIISVVLDGFIIAIQKLFNIREDHYRKLMEQKIKHLETGDYFDYAFEKVDKLVNPEDKNREILELLKAIRLNANSSNNGST